MKIVTGLRWVMKEGDADNWPSKVLQQQITDHSEAFGGLFNTPPTWEDVPTITQATDEK